MATKKKPAKKNETEVQLANVPSATEAKEGQSAETRTPSDLPRKAGETALAKYPVTPAAHVWLRDNRLDYNQQLRRMLVRRAENEGQQLNLETTQSVYETMKEIFAKEKAERQELYDSQPDTTVPAELLDDSSRITCKLCPVKFTPGTWNIVDRQTGEVVLREKGKLAGQPKRAGNFAITDDESADPKTGIVTTRVYGVCGEHRKLLKTYSYEEASYLAGKFNAQRQTEKEAESFIGRSQRKSGQGRGQGGVSSIFDRHFGNQRR